MPLKWKGRQSCFLREKNGKNVFNLISMHLSIKTFIISGVMLFEQIPKRFWILKHISNA